MSFPEINKRDCATYSYDLAQQVLSYDIKNGFTAAPKYSTAYPLLNEIIKFFRNLFYPQTNISTLIQGIITEAKKITKQEKNSYFEFAKVFKERVVDQHNFQAGGLRTFINTAELDQLLESLAQSTQLCPLFGKEEWETLGYRLENIPPLPLNSDDILQSDCPFWPEKKVWETHEWILVGSVELLDFGKKVMDKCQEKFPEKFPKSMRKHPNPIYVNFVDYKLTSKQVGPPPVKPYWALVTKDAVPESLGMAWNKRNAHLATFNYRGATPYEAVFGVIKNNLQSDCKEIQIACLNGEVGDLLGPCMRFSGAYAVKPERIDPESHGMLAVRNL